MNSKPLRVGERCRFVNALFPENEGRIVTIIKSPAMAVPDDASVYRIELVGPAAARAMQYGGPNHGELLRGETVGSAKRRQLVPLTDAGADAAIEAIEKVTA